MTSVGKISATKKFCPRHVLLVFLCLLFASCSSRTPYAPVEQAWYQDPGRRPEVHLVREGETLYAIAWRYDMDHRALAKINNLHPPYGLKVEQKLRLTNPRKSAKSLKVRHQVPHQRKKVKKMSKLGRKTKKKLSNKYRGRKNPTVSRWSWPTNGRLLQGFSVKDGHKGIDISGRKGQPVYSTKAGKVAYAGNGLRGYGNLLIIKHNDEFLSAYAHNRRLLVKEGDWVKVKQKIAEMGSTGTNRIKLHFELRKAGKPVDPLRYFYRPKA